CAARGRRGGAWPGAAGRVSARSRCDTVRGRAGGLRGRRSPSPGSGRNRRSGCARCSPRKPFYNGVRGLLRLALMPAEQRRGRRVTIRQVLDTAIELEKRTMDLYVVFVAAFPRPEEVRNFWFTMARHEAFHCGALLLVESVLRSDARSGRAAVRFDAKTVSRLRALLAAYLREARRGVTLERALEMAIDLEASELE